MVRQFGRPDRDAALKALIQEIYHEHKGRYGYRRIRDELRNRGHLINHKKVQRLMKALGLKSLVRMKKYRSYKGKVGNGHYGIQAFWEEAVPLAHAGSV
jgi:transposase InsO family protein